MGISNIINLNETALSIFNFKISFWLISLILLIILIIIKVKFLKELVKKAYLKIKKLFQWLWLKIKIFFKLLKERIKQGKHSRPNEGEIANFNNRLFFVIFVFIISILIVFCINIIPEIFNRNLSSEPEIKSSFLIIAFIAVFIIWIIITLISSSGLYGKEFSLWAIFLSVLYIAFKFPNNNYIRVLTILILGPTLIVYPHILKKNWKMSRIWLMITIMIMLFSFLGGTILIDTAYGYKPISFYLNIDGNTMHRYAGNGTVDCLNPEGKVLTNKMLQCSINPPLSKITNFSVTLSYDDEPPEIINSKNLTFVAKDNVKSVYFEIKGIDSKDEELFLTTGSTYKIYSIEEQTEREKQFVTIFLALIAVIFFSIPAMMVNLRDLSKRKTSEEY
jgi:hypothetical protein